MLECLTYIDFFFKFFEKIVTCETADQQKEETELGKSKNKTRVTTSKGSKNVSGLEEPD